jgi:subtilisin family serine protease
MLAFLSILPFAALLTAQRAESVPTAQGAESVAVVSHSERAHGETISVLLAAGSGGFDALMDSERGAELLAGARRLRSNRLDVHDLRLPAAVDAQELVERLAQLPEVVAAWVPGRGSWLEVPNDPSYAQQWHLSNDGSGGGVAGADVRAEDAWEISSGDPSVVIAILDSGVEITHPDLAPNVWHNAAEIVNGIDDDGNGYIDDVNGWDFFHDDGDVTGPFSHGTRVAGMVGARANDGFGVAGLAGGWGASPGCRVMAVAVGDSFPDAATLDDAILYAVDNGARVINLSLSITQNIAVDLALAVAQANDVLIVAASGNNGSFVSYPATRPEVMAVGATTISDTVASFSAPGATLEIAAPGDGVLTTSDAAGSASGVGTSFASPLVGAAAGLLFSRLPSLSAAEARAILIATAVDIETPGPDPGSGAGRLDAAAALERLEASDCDGNGLYDPAEIAANPLLDSDFNGVPDVCELGTPMCFGDGSGAASCPCGNLGLPGVGCANSTGGGAHLVASGSRVISANDFTLFVTGARGSQPGVFLQGLGLIESPFKDGILCAGNPTDRLEFVTTSPLGEAVTTADLAETGALMPGDTAIYQLWYRDPVVSPCGSGSNFSNAFAVDWI